MERLARALSDAADAAALRPALPGLAAFLAGLLDDRNFKVVVGGMQGLGDVAEAVGAPVQAQLRCDWCPCFRGGRGMRRPTASSGML
jgi:hypothetical protein